MADQVSTIIEQFYHWEKETPQKIFLRQPYGSEWKQITYEEAGQEARKMASALRSLGLKKGDHIGILSKNCYHWILADLAIMMAECVSVPYYASLPKNKLAEVVRLSDIKLLFVGKLDKWDDKGEAIPEGVQVIHFPHYKDNALCEMGYSWDELIGKHEPQLENPVPDLDDIWTIKFTSGTTGTPKGVMLQHKAPALAMRDEIKTNFIGIMNMKANRWFSFLPLNHVAERMAVEVPCLYVGGTISFAESLDTFAQNIRDTQPTVLFAVPRIWVKFYHGVMSQMSQKKMDRLLRIPIVSGMVRKKIRTALGLRDAEIVATGAAITPEFLKKWYRNLGLHLVEAYGMTEVCGSISNGTDLSTPADSVGRAIPAGEIRIHPETGEILMKTPYMMLGYYKEPEKTAEVLIDGWMHSGDRGTIDENGYVRVIGRVKDAFKTAKGSYITPNPMEEVLSNNEYIEQCCVAGLGIPQPICLVNLTEQGMKVERDRVNDSLTKDLASLNKTLSAYERISTIIINRETWSESNDLLTPTMKVKRSKLDDHYGPKYLAWHEHESRIIWEE